MLFLPSSVARAPPRPLNGITLIGGGDADTAEDSRTTCAPRSILTSDQADGAYGLDYTLNFKSTANPLVGFAASTLKIISSSSGVFTTPPLLNPGTGAYATLYLRLYWRRWTHAPSSTNSLSLKSRPWLGHEF